VPTASDNACITNGTAGTPTVVNVTGILAEVNNLQLGGFNNLNINSSASVSGGLQVNGTQIINNGQIDLNAGAHNAGIQLESASGATLSGTGTITLSTSGAGLAYLGQTSAGHTLTNQSTIDGAGQIGNGALRLDNQGTVNADTNGQILSITGSDPATDVNTGTLEATNGGILQINDETVNNQNGTITVGAGSSIQVVNNGTIEGWGNISAGGTLNNGGTINANTNGQILSLAGVGGYTNTGTLEATRGGILQINQATVNDQNGTITAGAGSSIQLVNNAVVQGGTFFNNLGMLSIDNTSRFVVGGAQAGTGYIQLANGMLNEMIASNNSFGVINSSSSALLNGTLNILLQGSFDPTVGSTFKILLANAGQINGTFSSIENDTFTGGPEAGTEKWVVDYDSAGGYVELIAEPLPEPKVLFILVPALLGAGFKLRHQLFRVV
jgi:hypothetical protein